jgi:hypothetical protein
MRISVSRAVFLLSTVHLAAASGAETTAVHVWEPQELTLTAQKSFSNPYTDLDFWVDLSGPDFKRRVYGFWDGGRTFRVRLVATRPGRWTWRSGSEPRDPGLEGKSGEFTAVDWSEEEKQANPLRRGFIRATSNQHALEYADGTPYFAVGDSWFAAGTGRFKWSDDENRRPIGPEAGFKDYVNLRQGQGFNWICLIAAFPNWMTDGEPWNVTTRDPDPFCVRSAWTEFGTGSAKNMDNEGGRPFQFPGKMPGYEQMFPDVDRLNPEYFKFIDRKIAYLNAHGFIPFIEASRRDATLVWSRYYKWPASYARFIHYVWARYQAYNVVLGPVHLDIIRASIRPAQYLEAINFIFNKWGRPPFDTLLSANAHPSTLENWGEDSWVTLHQIGNVREHDNYWYLTEIFQSSNPKPALNGEPYYSGYSDPRHSVKRMRAPGGTPADDRYVRSGMYGSFLSGGLAGHIYGAEGIWGADIEPAAPIKMWDAFQWSSAGQMRYLSQFAMSIGKRYQELVPNVDLVSPNKTADIASYDGWAYCARTADRNIFLLYFEKSAPQEYLRGAKLDAFYDAAWFDPRNGSWVNVRGGRLRSSNTGNIPLPAPPADDDWGLRLVYQGPAPPLPDFLPLSYLDAPIEIPIWHGKKLTVRKLVGPAHVRAAKGLAIGIIGILALLCLGASIKWFRRRRGHGTVE